jgi:hypothetical protein
VVALALALAPAAHAATTTTFSNPLQHGSLVAGKAQSSKQQVIDIFLRYPKVAHWLKRYPRNPTTDATYKDGSWTVNVWSGRAGEIATGTVDDVTRGVVEAWTGPQVAWRMARGYHGAFGGTLINSYGFWLGLCGAFLLGLVDWRRPLSLRNLDLVVLLSLSVSLWFFNRGHVFAAMSLAYPPLAWLLGRCLWIGHANRPARGRPVVPVWFLIAATIFLAGFRLGVNQDSSNIIDVGYSGVIGADRIAHGQSPYGHFPQEDDLKACGPADSSGEIRDRIQTNGICETANPLGDTYGPVAYLAYLPGYWLFGWNHHWGDKLEAVHLTSMLFDSLCLVGLVLVGWRFGGRPLGATLGFAWVAWPFSLYASASNTNDMIPPALLIWGFLLLTSPIGRGAVAAVSGWTKFASLLLVPLWAGYPEARRPRPAAVYAVGFAAATVLVFFPLFFEPSLFHAVRVFYDRTIAFQVGRDSPFSIWDWGQYHAKGLPNLHLVQLVLQVALVAGAAALAWIPRRRSPLQFAALTGAVLVGFELVLTHWFYLYLPWFFPFVALALVGPLPGHRESVAAA